MSDIGSNLNFGSGLDTYRHVHMLNLAAFPEVV